MNSPRILSILLLLVYVFGPMLVFPIKEVSYAQSIKPDVFDQSLGDLVNGMGGPEELTIDSFLVIENNDSNIFDTGNSDTNNNSVVVTKTVNYLKISDTTMPVDNPIVSSDYGWRTAPCKGCSSNHQGTDFTPGYGSPVMAIAEGMIIDMGKNGGYGNFVRIKHLMGNSEGGIDEWVTLYAHMKDGSFPEELKIGSVVKSGDRIGLVGNTGMSTGPHLHFELIINGENVDPLPLLGTYEVITVTEEEFDDYLFVGAKFRVVETVVEYE